MSDYRSRAYVSDDFARNGVSIFLAHDRGNGRALANPVELAWSEAAASEAAAGWVHDPTLRLPDDVARALLDALVAHYGGTSEVQTLRKDYLAERARVDKMIDHLTTARA